MSKECQKIHEVMRSLPRYRFPLEKDKIFKNGIYILFEKDELAHAGERIVRIGTHRGDNNLYNRLKEHFINENKDRSIFRKNIGRALLNKNHDSYLDIWELDLQVKQTRQEYQDVIDLAKQLKIEKTISKYIQDNFSFAIIEVPQAEARLFYESKLISTVSLCQECVASANWLGKSSPKEKIVKSHLWLVNELYKEPFTENELKEFIAKYIKAPKLKKIAVFASGNGTDLQAIIDGTRMGKITAKVGVVISNNKDAFALKRAEASGIPYYHLASEDFSSLDEFNDKLLKVLKKHRIDIIFLAGYLKKVSSKIIKAYQAKIFNIHPALLPKYGGKGMYGINIHQEVIKNQEKETGITIHQVDEAYDTGNIIAQTKIPVLKSDTPETLQARVLAKEHEFIVDILAQIIKDSDK